MTQDNNQEKWERMVKKTRTIPDSNTNKVLRSVTEHKLETDLIIYICFKNTI